MSTLAYQSPYAVAAAPADERAAFIRRTYTHLALAILAFVAVEIVLFKSGLAGQLVQVMLGGKYSWLIVLGAFMGVSWVADKWARSDTSQGMQYLGLGLYVVAQAVIFVPLLAMAIYFSTPDVLPCAVIMTGVLFAGLTATVFITRKDFSFLRGIITIGGFVALGLIVASILFGFHLGLIFSGAMVLIASAAILYTTSNILHEYNPNQHVAASLALFASVALLFWYVLRIFMSLTNRD